MRVFRDIDSLPEQAKGAVVALGNFDGVHLGHRAILQETRQRAKALETTPAVLTFEPHPREFFAPNKPRLRLSNLAHKLELLAECGIEHVFVLRFNATLAATRAEDFISRILTEKLAARHVITGHNFFFGKDRKGNKALLEQAAQQGKFGYKACAPVVNEQGEVVSSSAIREALAAGDLVTARAMLGRNYGLRAHVIHGEKRGRTIGFPTMNLPLAQLFTPRFGVYAVRFRFGGESAWHEGIANLGVKPTFGGNQPLLEVHGFDFSADMYGWLLHVELLNFIREEKKFSGIESLRAQIQMDCQSAKILLKEIT
jgi:riboflavin kinase/FMN adenylyltransferase